MITNLSPTMPFTVNIGKGVYPNLEVLQKLIRAKVANLIAFNATTLAKEAGNVMAVNMVLLGALIQTKTLPISTDHVKTVIRTRTKQDFVQINVTAFDLGYSAAQAVSKVENA